MVRLAGKSMLGLKVVRLVGKSLLDLILFINYVSYLFKECVYKILFGRRFSELRCALKRHL